ncbi:MAG: hypothetical protein FWG96_01640 [Methanomassiliicoccaceae archaeon]|nr:hypothetical protein [Methanomassiliicoccaceae archaeon]
MGIGQEILNVPFGEMVYQVASAIAKSQAELDSSSVEILSMMGDKKNYPVSLPALDLAGNETEIETSMIGAGFQPAFYQFTDAIIEVKMAISMTRETEASTDYKSETKSTSESNKKATWYNRNSTNSSTVRTTTVNANYTNRYSFNEEASSTLRVRLVPLPPNPIIQRLIDLRAQREQYKFEVQMKSMEEAAKKELENQSSSSY